jgi:class 3 adenylate cyclase/tetratricopeptide (TPR) repeat protein
VTATPTPPTELIALNADVVGYSRLLADDFDTTTATMEEYRHLVERTIESEEGTLVNFVGDNFMAVFEDATNAVRAAIATASEIEVRNADVPESHRVRFRMGMDQGEVAVTDDQWFGDALNIAARIQAIAAPGGLSVSGRVYRALDEPALRFRSIGHRRLKNIPEETDVHEFVDLPSDRATAAEPSTLALDSPTVAVLPIHVEGADDTVRATAGVIRNDLLHRLSSVPQLQVVDARDEPTKGGVGVSARYMVESGVHQAGDQVRIYAAVFDVTTMNVVKSHKWTVGVDELFTVSDDLADEVARSIEVELIVGEPAGLYAELDAPAAIEKIYLGWYHLRSDTQQGWRRALELFGDVARSHPEQPYGHVLSAFANWSGASRGWGNDSEKLLERAREQARLARRLGDPTGMAQAVEAAILMSQGREEEALDAMDHLEIIRPTCDVTYGLEGSVRRYLGQWEKAVDLVDVAMRLTGVNKPWYPTVKACSLYIGGRHEQAASVAEMVLEHQPRNLEALLVLTAAQVEMGMDRRARATADVVRERFPSVDVEAWLDRNPFQDPEIVERWKQNLAAVGTIDRT